MKLVKEWSSKRYELFFFYSNNYGALVRIEGLQDLIPSSEIITDKPLEELIG